MPSSVLRSWRQALASNPNGRVAKALFRRVFGRRFQGASARRLLVLFEPNRISYASVYPFLCYADAFAATHDVEIRLFPVARVLASGLPSGLSDPTHVVAQTWLTDPPARQAALAAFLETLPPGTITAYLDTFANTDIRLAGQFQNVDLYFKKALFADLHQFQRPTYGHTNLTEYYGRLYDLPDIVTDWQVPTSALAKLRLAPNFLTDAMLRSELLGASAPDAGRDIDLHARLGGTAHVGWYGEMRRHAQRTVDEIKGLRVASGTGIAQRAFMDELRRSRICFSPFGFGELCWRDVEAIAAGAVLLKPDMSHLKSEPDLYRDGETYVACRWDFADLEDKVRALIADEARCLRISQTARERARAYLLDAGPVSTYGALFASCGG